MSNSHIFEIDIETSFIGAQARDLLKFLMDSYTKEVSVSSEENDSLITALGNLLNVCGLSDDEIHRLVG